MTAIRGRTIDQVATRILIDVGLILGGSFALVALVAMVHTDGGLAYDTHAYWLAAKHILDGTTLYSPASPSELGAFKYPPIFAQLFAPAALAPEIAVDWAWRVSR